MAAPATPKFDVKMLVMPCMLLISRKISFTTPNPDYICDDDGNCPDVKVIPKELNNTDIIEKAQMGLMCVSILLMTMFYYIYGRAKSSKDADKKVWVPPKPKPALPFNMGPPPEPLTIEEFKETTLGEHECGLVREQAQALVFPIAIAYFMSLKFNVHVSLLMQGVMLPVNSLDSGVVKKYILGAVNNGEGETMYNELTKAPTAADVKAINDKAGAAAAETTPAVTDKDDEPRVVELDNEDAKDNKAKKV